MGRRFNILLLLLFFLFSGCSKSKPFSLANKKDYRLSLKSFYQNKKAQALNRLPTKEKGTFISDMEQAYLNLLLGKPEIASLQKYATLIDQRVRYEVSRELMSFFYIKTPEGYYASEHEVILLHLFLSWGYTLQKKPEAACVEVRKASHLLNAPWSEEGHFDDPLLRLMSAGLWAMCGSWEDAQIDYRAAWSIDNTLGWAKQLAEMESPPRHLVMILGGTGPVVSWNPELTLNVVRGIRNIQFRTKTKKRVLSVMDSDANSINLYLSPLSMPWYQRHLVRDNEIQDLIKDTHYAGESILNTGIGGVRMIAGYTGATLIGIGGLGIGAGVIYLGAQAHSGEIAGLGGAICIGALGMASKMIGKTNQETATFMKKELDASRSYRFVRYLPEYMWVGWSNKDISYPLTVSLKEEKKEYEPVSSSVLPVVKGVTNISIMHYADVHPPLKKDPPKELNLKEFLLEQGADLENIKE